MKELLIDLFSLKGNKYEVKHNVHGTSISTTVRGKKISLDKTIMDEYWIETELHSHIVMEMLTKEEYNVMFECANEEEEVLKIKEISDFKQEMGSYLKSVEILRR